MLLMLRMLLVRRGRAVPVLSVDRGVEGASGEFLWIRGRVGALLLLRWLLAMWPQAGALTGAAEAQAGHLCGGRLRGGL